MRLLSAVRGLLVISAWLLASTQLAGCATCQPDRMVLLPTQPARGTGAENYVDQQVSGITSRYVRMPVEACRSNQTGTPVLDLEFDRTGRLVSVALAQSSGHRTLDDALLSAWQRAQSDGARIDLPPEVIGSYSSLRYRTGLSFSWR
jgi:TonB family protein